MKTKNTVTTLILFTLCAAISYGCQQAATTTKTKSRATQTSNTATDETTCESQGAYSAKFSCESAVGGTCKNVIVSTGSRDLSCYTADTNNNGQCGADNWQTGEWTPSSCNAGTTQTRSVTCKTGCTCDTTQPSSSRGCPTTCTDSTWKTTSWSPAACGPGVSTLTRTVSCDAGCTCTATQPSNTTVCKPDLFENKHYESECTKYTVSTTTAQGVLTQTGRIEVIDGHRVCGIPIKIDAAPVAKPTCPSGWKALTVANIPYTITKGSMHKEHMDHFGGRRDRFTGEHTSYMASPVESIKICTTRNAFGCKSHTTYYAATQRIACY